MPPQKSAPVRPHKGLCALRLTLARSIPVYTSTSRDRVLEVAEGRTLRIVVATAISPLTLPRPLRRASGLFIDFLHIA